MTSITIPNSVTSIGSDAFYNCSKLTKVNISDLASWFKISFSNSTSNPLYYAQHLYLNNTELTEITVPSSITQINDYALYGASAITSVTIPSSVTSIGSNAFYGCSGLTSINIPDGVTSIGSRAFYNCSSIQRIYIPSSVTTISASSYSDSPFYGWNSSAVIYCGAASKPSGWGNYWNYYGSSSQLKVVWNVVGIQQNSEWEYLEKNDGTIGVLKSINIIKQNGC